MSTFDLTIIGASFAGCAAAIRAARLMQPVVAANARPFNTSALQLAADGLPRLRLAMTKFGIL